MFSLLLPPVHLSLIILTRGSWLQVSPSPVAGLCTFMSDVFWLLSTAPTTNPGKKEQFRSSGEPLLAQRSPCFLLHSAGQYHVSLLMMLKIWVCVPDDVKSNHHTKGGRVWEP